jgi:hypothetical protein
METPISHTWLSHKSPSVGEDGENLTTSSIHTKYLGIKGDVSSALPKKREREKRRRKKLMKKIKYIEK